MTDTTARSLATIAHLDHLVFDNRFVDGLPADPSEEIRPRQVSAAAFSRVVPKQTAKPALIAVAAEVAELLEIPTDGLDDLGSDQADAFASVFSGNTVLPGMDPWANNYGGHQFGNWAGQLGDGRAMGLGEIRTSTSEHWTVQLKGAGPTPYSRRADGLAVLRSSIREFLCSEAMHHLGVPTTRALSLVSTGDEVLRDMFYDGNAKMEPGAVVARVAPSFTRFGTFELPASRGDLATLRTLVEFTIRTDFPELVPADLADDADADLPVEVMVAWFEEIVRRTAEMIVHWMRVGFVHGVMNTDNMSVLGLTIDYGPYGWLEDYDPNWTPNTTDAGGRRYRFANQPAIAQWNLLQLANALFPLIDQVEPLQDAINRFVELYTDGRRTMMAAKLGVSAPTTPAEIEAFEKLDDDLWGALAATETDMTIFFRGLADVPIGATGDPVAADDDLVAPLLDAHYRPDEFTGEARDLLVAWLHRWVEQVRAAGATDADRRTAMNAVNPKYVLRNYLAQLAIDKSEGGDHSMVGELLDVLRHPYDEQPGNESFAEKRPEWARVRAGCSMLSCSS